MIVGPSEGAASPVGWISLVGFWEVCVLERPPEHLTLDRMQTPLGQALLITDEDHRLRARDWEDHAARMQRQLRLHYGSNISLNSGRAPRGTRVALEAYFAGDLEQLDGIDPVGMP
jgi:methylated-DNA-[protein]-cysteine S-methyltransferase